MKRLVFAILALVVTFAVSAQSENSIIIDQSSFRAVQTDALTGVAIDPISVDSSRRPCARIKVRLNRMTREEINEIEVKIVTNNELRKCRTVDYDNGLIIEMTAKPETRFYFQHPRLGHSNDVLVNLEANREYGIDASLNQTFSIVVDSNVVGAEVYIDDVLKGKTENNDYHNLIISDVLVGKHILRLVYNGISYEKNINVDKTSIQFSQFVDLKTSKYSYLSFEKGSTINKDKTKTTKEIPFVNWGIEGSIDGYIHSFSTGFGIAMRIGKYSSLFNGTIGCKYLYTSCKKWVSYFYGELSGSWYDGDADYKRREHKLLFPISFNCNIITPRWYNMSDTDKYGYSWYVGLGYELGIVLSEYRRFENPSLDFNENDLYNSGKYTGLDKLPLPSHPIVIQFGCSGRHLDWKVYYKYFINHSYYDVGMVGISFTYYF